jgi:transcriptional regulator with XRE-family HTH domain
MESPERRFARWLSRVLSERGWSQAELARRSQLSSSHISRLLSGTRCPKVEACTRLAQALHLSQEVVFQQAGLIKKSGAEHPEVDELCTIARLLPEQDRRDLLLSARDRLARQRGPETGTVVSPLTMGGRKAAPEPRGGTIRHGKKDR